MTERTYTPPRLSDRAEAAYHAAPRSISMGMPNADGPEARSYKAAKPLNVMDLKPRPLPGNNRDRVRRAMAELGAASVHEIYLRAGAGFSAHLNRQTVRVTINNLVEFGHAKRHADGRVELTAAGRALVAP